jgi:hypothetical protein
MVKVIRRSVRITGREEVAHRCTYIMEGREVRFDCRGCPGSRDAPNERCLQGIRSALEVHPEACGLLLIGDEHIWIRERGVTALRSLMAAEKAWEELRETLIDLPCHRTVPPQRVMQYLERVRSGHSERFCQGEGEGCRACIALQERALKALQMDRNRARRTLATDRFRIVEVMGGEI